MGFREEEELEYLRDKLTAHIVKLEEEIKRLSQPVRSAFWGADIEKMLSDYAHEIMGSGNVNRFAEEIGKEIATYVHDTELHIERLEGSHAVLESLLHDKVRQLIDALDKISELEEEAEVLSWKVVFGKEGADVLDRNLDLIELWLKDGLDRLSNAQQIIDDTRNIGRGGA